MTDGPRALLTDREKDMFRGDPDVKPGTARGLKSRVDTKIERLREEVQFLHEHNEEYAERVCEAACEGTNDAGNDARIDRIERELNELRDRVDALDEESGGESG